MKASEHVAVNLTQSGTRHETRTRYEQNVPGAVFFDCLISGAAAVGPKTPFGLIIATPTILGVPRDFQYDVSVWQGTEPDWTDVISHRPSSGGGRSSLKLNCWVDSSLPVTVKVFCPASWKVKTRIPFWTVWEPLLSVFIQAKHLQAVPIG